ncbi:MAG: ABC transporter permease [Chloroflexi bacterium]|nr:ABC transporter permease [Chloroflexota bacterium]MBV9133478.1 ABC transporter permease [Chloroflexota bacterium]MBV9898829.1 ABC transporter permease [Chloroflexota bacterium]
MIHEIQAIWAIVRKDVGVWARQPTAVAATVLPALVLIGVLYIGAAAVGRNPVALVVEDNGPAAQQLQAILEDSDAFVVTLASRDQAARMLQDLQVAAVITIPANFDTAFDAHQTDPVDIQINNLNLDFTNDLRRSLPAAITDFYAQQPDNPIDVQVRESDIREQDVGLVQFDLVPDLVLLLTIAGVVNAGLATAREWEDLTIKELLLAPIGRGSLIVGKLLAGWLTTLLIAALVLAIGALTGYLRPVGASWVPTLLTVLLLALASAGLGVAIGATTRRFQRVAGLSIPLAFYLFFLSGGISVIAFLPDWVQAIAQFVPTYYGMHALQMAVFYNSTDDLARDLGVLAVTAAVTLALGVASLRRGFSS